MKGGVNWSEATISQQMPAATRNWKKQSAPSRASRGNGLCQHLDYNPGMLIWDAEFYHLERRENKFLLG